MTGRDYKAKIYDLRFTAGVCARYHHKLEDRYSRRDRMIRATVAVLSVISLPFAVKDVPPWGLITAIVLLAAAGVLNIYLVGEWAKSHGELYRLWSDLRRDADLEELKAGDLADTALVQDYMIHRLHELVGKQHHLDAVEGCPDGRLAIRCHEDETEAEWGSGIRTPAQVANEQELRQASSPTSAAASEAASAD